MIVQAARSILRTPSEKEQDQSEIAKFDEMQDIEYKDYINKLEPSALEEHAKLYGLDIAGKDGVHVLLDNRKRRKEARDAADIALALCVYKELSGAKEGITNTRHLYVAGDHSGVVAVKVIRAMLQTSKGEKEGVPEIRAIVNADELDDHLEFNTDWYELQHE